MKTMFKKSQKNFEKLPLKCTEDHKTEIKNCLNFTEDRKSFYRKILKKSVKILKHSSGKQNKHCRIGNEFSRTEKDNNFLTKRSSEGLKEFSLKKVLK